MSCVRELKSQGLKPKHTHGLKVFVLYLFMSRDECINVARRKAELCNSRLLRIRIKEMAEMK